MNRVLHLLCSTITKILIKKNFKNCVSLLAKGKYSLQRLFIMFRMKSALLRMACIIIICSHQLVQPPLPPLVLPSLWGLHTHPPKPSPVDPLVPSCFNTVIFNPCAAAGTLVRCETL